ncbi:FAD-dependent oxidoreductase [Paeniglutamicibacter psychrophenolicus]|uniref:FAD-dependent oxidoreductase n=1 Tax=Paeniglutamicibacter psychrophenolicus TaxID=257454 RepID=UPI002788D7D6|nr:FAD-dependent oxidoreductase [Paeniglutamicibacter psychrophenolicus]MDQ0093008.1 sarcosine oxidase [Paeniglutamicibacter psychrophenolicus]
MVARLDTVVVGGGAMGSATAWALATRGREVTLLEQFEPGHALGASHGTTRNLNPGYRDPVYVSMLVEALELWERLGAQSGEAQIARTGIVNHGAPAEQGRVLAALSEAGIRAEELSAAQATERWSGIRFAGPALHMPDGGQLNPDLALPSFQRVATGHGARIRHGVRVVEMKVLGDKQVSLTLESAAGAETIEARNVVVTAGAWTRYLLPGSVRLPALRVTQEQPVHFAPLDADTVWPGFNHTLVPGSPGFEHAYSPVYGMSTPGEGIKAGWHGTGAPTHPDARSFASEPKQLRALQDYARKWLPGVDADSFTELSCTYTNTPDEDFILDRIGPITIGAGFSGHGFKFTPVIGRILADLASGSGPAPAKFAAGRTIGDSVLSPAFAGNPAGSL